MTTYTRENPPPGTTHLRRGSEKHIFYKVLSDGSAMFWSNTQRDWLKSRIFKGIPQASLDPVSHKAAAGAEAKSAFDPPKGATHVFVGDTGIPVFYKILQGEHIRLWKGLYGWLIVDGDVIDLPPGLKPLPAAAASAAVPTPMPSDMPGIKAQPLITPAPAFMLVDHKPAKPNEGLLTVAEIGTIGGVKLWGDDA